MLCYISVITQEIKNIYLKCYMCCVYVLCARARAHTYTHTYTQTRIYIYLNILIYVCTLYIYIPQESQVSVKCLSDKKKNLL